MGNQSNRVGCSNQVSRPEKLKDFLKANTVSVSSFSAYAKMANHEIFNTLVNTMWNALLSFVFVFILVPGISTSAEQRTLEIEFSFAAPNYPDKHLVGYRLYKEN